MFRIYKDDWSSAQSLLFYVNSKTGEKLNLGDISAADWKRRNNALHLAFYQDKPEVTVIEELISRGIDQKEVNRNGKTPWAVASDMGHWSFVLRKRFKELGSERGQKVCINNIMTFFKNVVREMRTRFEI